MTILWRGFNGVSDTVVTSIGLPTGTELGDTVFIVGYSWGSFTCTDSRFEKVSDLDPPSRPSSHGEVWRGVATDLTAVQFTVTDWVWASVMVGSCKNKADPSRSGFVSVSDARSGFNLPGLPSRGDGAVAFYAAEWTFSDFALTAPSGWSLEDQGVYAGVGILYTDNDTTASTPVSVTHFSSNPIGLEMAVIGLGPLLGASPGRLFPREDGLGVGGGRVYPPPKSQQHGARGFGYY